MLSDSGEDGKVKGTRKVGGVGKKGKRKREIGSVAPRLPSFLLSYFHVRTFSIKRTPQSRSLEQATSPLE